MITQIAGYLSGIAIILSFIPYIRDIYLKKTKPERMSWLVWAILGFISFFSQSAKGAHYSLIMTAAQAFGDLFIFILAIKHGVGGLLKRDILALIGSAISLFIWYLTKEATLTVFIIIFIDAIGVVLTLTKLYDYPGTETISSWVLTFIAGFLALIAVGKFDLILLAVPFYICISSMTIIITTKLGYMRKNRIRS